MARATVSRPTALSYTGLSQAQIKRFSDQGFLLPGQVLTSEEVAYYRGEFESVCQSGQSLRFAHLRYPWAYHLACRPNILSLVESLLGNEIIVWGTLMVPKLASSQTHVPWHQDSCYFDRQSGPAISAWLALSPVDQHNGCMQFIPASHQCRLAHIERADGNSMLRQGQQVATEIDAARAFDVNLAAGEVSFHHLDLVHGSQPNRSARDRIGFVIRYCTPRVRSLPYPVIQARGDAPCAHLDLAEAPVHNR